jgi:hypothetical protein
MFKKITSIAFAAFAMAGAGVSSASAQSTSWYVSPNNTPSFEGLNSLNSVINSAPTFSNLPISFDIGGTTGQITFSGQAGTSSGSGIHNADGSAYAGNHIVAASGGFATIDFTTQQKFLSLRWGSVDSGNLLSFYNGDQLLQSVTGAQAMAVRTGDGAGRSYDAGFSFGEVGFTRVVATASIQLGNIAFSDTPPPEVAPIPLNAASLGGLLSFLMMLAMRGKGGTQVAIRMALASIMPRRRGLA